MSKTVMYIPKFDVDVLVEFNDELGQFDIDYIPNDKFTDEELKEEVEIIIVKMLESIVEENK